MVGNEQTNGEEMNAREAIENAAAIAAIFLMMYCWMLP
jgi:hypothetical protein